MSGGNSNNFTIKPAGYGSLNDFLDLNDVFQDDFFPSEVDFSGMLDYYDSNTGLPQGYVAPGGQQQQQQGQGLGGDYALSYAMMDGGMGQDMGLAMGQIQGQQQQYQQRYQQYQQNYQGGMQRPQGGGMGQAMGQMQGQGQGQGNMSDKDRERNKNRSIVIPPSMPRYRPPMPMGDVKPLPEKKSGVAGEKEEEKKELKKDSKEKEPSKKKLKKGKEEEPEPEEDLEGEDNMTESQRVERRERNREHAKRSRIRKRVLLETLQDQLAELRSQNVKLRRVVGEHIPEHAGRILSECTTEESSLLAHINSSDEEGEGGRRKGGLYKASRLTSAIASDIAQSHGSSSSGAGVVAPTKQTAKILMEPDFRLIHSLVTSQQNFVLSDPSLPDNPIVYASDGFCRMSGYKRQDILGRNCRFLQGPGTDQAAVDVIRQGVAEGRDISVCLLNYRADGSPFWNQFFLGALKDADGQVVNYVGVQCEVNTIPVNEIKDRVKRLPMPDDL